jgi:hypothetical protein
VRARQQPLGRRLRPKGSPLSILQAICHSKARRGSLGAMLHACVHEVHRIDIHQIREGPGCTVYGHVVIQLTQCGLVQHIAARTPPKPCLLLRHPAPRGV